MPVGHLDEQNQFTGRLQRIITLAEAQTGASQGTWIPLLGIRPFTFQVEGISGDVVRLLFSNAPQIPANSNDGGQWGTDITANVAQIFDAPVRWVKLRKVSGSSAVSAWIYAG